VVWKKCVEGLVLSQKVRINKYVTLTSPQSQITHMPALIAKPERALHRESGYDVIDALVARLSRANIGM